MTAQSERVLVRGGRPWGLDRPADVLVGGGRIIEVADTIDGGEATIVDASGTVLIPGLVDAHCHIDKTLFGLDWVPHSAGPQLIDRIANERTRRGELGLPRDEAMSALIETMIAAGTTRARTHTDVFPEAGLAGVEAVRDAAQRYERSIDIEQVGFPQHGILATPGTYELLDELAGGGLLAAIGGIDPAGVDGDPIRSLDAVFELAASHGVGVDIHLHDPGTLGLWQLDAIAAHTERFGLGGRVTVGHAFALGAADESDRERTAERLAGAGVGLVTAAVYDLPIPALDTMARHGVVLGLGSDGVRDLWGPYGDGDMLRRATQVAYRSGFRRDEQLELALRAATTGGAELLGLDPPAVAPGHPADLVAVRAESPAQAVAAPSARALVFKGGRLVATDGGLVDR